MLSKIRTKITFANVISLIALFVALGGTVYAAGKLNGHKVKKGSLPGNRIVPNTVKGKQVNEGSLGQVPERRRREPCVQHLSFRHDRFPG